MKNPIKKIALILILIIILPALIFSLVEIGSLNEREQVIEEIYNNQLDAILFSVNQYSEDVISSWRSKINLLLTEKISHPGFFKTKADSFLSINKAISSIIFADSLNTKIISELKYFKDSNKIANNKNNPVEIKNFLKNYSAKIKKLYTYERGGYSKIEPLPDLSTDSSTIFIFLLDDPENLSNICIMTINPIKFVRDVLGSKIKEIAEDKFIITCSSLKAAKAKDFIFATDNLQDREIQQKKNLWLIPNYQIGILLKGQTIEGLAKSRSTTNLILILILIITLIVGVYIVFKNIRKEMELARIKSDFVSNVSHELRTPLALISMFAETLEMGRASTEEKKKEYYTIISKEAARLSRIVNKILSFSRIEAGKKEYHFSRIDLNFLVEDVFNSYQFHLKNNGFQFSFLPANAVPEIEADGEAISEAIINLIDNAIKYSSDKKEISIITGIEQGFAYIEIDDKGIGISEENQKKIFEKFYRVSDGLIHNTKGTGLGLTLVKHIVDAHHGKIKVKSKLNEGSSFVLSFPINNLNK
ncbi:MAG: HAMP domain-containing sensor histidine kinase [Ignavibacteriaceae bacterium]